MKVVFVFNDFPLHNHIIESYMRERPGDSVALVKVPLLLKGKGRGASAARVLPKLSKRFILNKLEEHLAVALLTALPRFLGGPANFKHLATIARQHALPFHLSSNVMSKETLDFIEQQEPDIVVSMFHQIIGRDLIRIPPLGVVNIHPGILPDFRGIQPYFWKLAEPAAQGGVTLHLIEDQEIDTGRLLAQARYPIDAGMSVTMNYYRAAVSAAAILPATLALMQAAALEPRKQDAQKGAYYRWPDSQAFDRLVCNGHSMLSIYDLLRIAYGYEEQVRGADFEIFRRMR